MPPCRWHRCRTPWTKDINCTAKRRPTSFIIFQLSCWSLEPCKCNWLQTTNLETYYWNISAAGAALQACTKRCYVPSHGCFDMHLFHGFPWCRASSDSNNHSCQLLIISVLPGLLVSAIPVYLGIIRRYHAVSLQSCIMCFRQSKK